MKTFFDNVKHLLFLNIMSYQTSSFSRETVDASISRIYESHWQECMSPMPLGDSDDEDYENDAKSIYRKTSMSFVDHFASLRLLERRSVRIPVDESIKLFLISVKHPVTRYFPSKEMKKAIDETCRVVGSQEDVRLEGPAMIDKIKIHLDTIKGAKCKVITSFQTLLKYDSGRCGETSLNYPLSLASIHCESSLAADLWQFHHCTQDSNLRKFFQARSSLHSFPSLPDLRYRLLVWTRTFTASIIFLYQSSVVPSLGSFLMSSTVTTPGPMWSETVTWRSNS